MRAPLLALVLLAPTLVLAGPAHADALPDLVLLAVDGLPEVVKEGTHLRLRVTVANEGTAPADGVQVAVYVEGRTTLAHETVDLAPGERRVVETSEWWAEPGNWTLSAHVDVYGAVAESDESDNSWSRPLSVAPAGLPNLLVKEFTMTPERPAAGESIRFHAVVLNDGGTSGPHNDTMILSDGWGLSSHGGWPWPQSELHLEFERALPEGEHTLTIRLDVDDAVAESDESDNLVVVSFRVGPGALPDLAVTRIEAAFDDPANSGYATVKVYGENRGIVPASATQVHVAIAEYDVTVDVQPLPPGEHLLVHWSLPLAGSPVPLRAVIDPFGVVAESDETNNAYETMLDLGAPDLLPAGMDVVALDPFLGAATLRFHERNDGTLLAWDGLTGVLDGDESGGRYWLGSFRLAPGETATSEDLTFLLGGGAHAFDVTADVRGSVPESDETNNVLSIPFELPRGDLQVRILDLSHDAARIQRLRDPTGQTHLTVEACNVGAWRIHDAEVGLRARGTRFHEELLHERWLSLAPGECRTWQVAWQEPIDVNVEYQAYGRTAEAQARLDNDEDRATSPILRASTAALPLP